ncbi:MAG: minor capsid protein [Kiritimatiellia bacterium]
MVAPTANEQLYDALVRHQTYLLRYSSHVRNRITNILNATEEDIARRIRDKLMNNKGLTTPVEWRRLQALTETLSAIRGEAWAEANKYWLEEGVQLAYQEPITFGRILATTSPVVIETVMPSARLLKHIAMSRPFEGRVMKDWARTMASEDIRRMSNAIQMGMVAGEDSATIARRVVGTGAFRGADGMTQITRRQVQAITRTAVNHIANNARSEFLQENQDFISEEQYVATLDARTTPVCRMFDGQIFPLGKGPMPPLHYACRSLRIAAFNGERMGQRPAKASTEKQLLREYAEKNNLEPVASRAHLPRGTKGDYDKFSRARVRELTGTVPASTTYQTWLEKQSVQFQNDTLGVTKGKLFRDGGLKLDRFVDNNGHELSLKDIAVRDSDAFRAAGLDPDRYK